MRRSTGCGAITVVLLCLVVAVPATGVERREAPSVTGITWHPRTGTTASPVLHITLSFDAPAGLASGEVRLGSVFHEILADVELAPQGPGSHSVHLEVVPTGDKLRSWEVIGLALNGSDGQTTTYGFCELASLLETREKATSPRLGLECLDGPGWVAFTLRAGDDPSAILWSRGVATRDHTYAGTGHVMQDASGEVETWGTAVTVAYPKAHDGTRVRVGGNTLVNEPSSDPSAQPGTNRIVVGIGGSAPSTMTPGAVYRWAAYYAFRPGHFDLPFITLEGTGLEVLDVEKGSTAGIAWGKDFDHSIVAQRSDADAAVFADGTLSRSFSKTTTCMFLFLTGQIGDVASANVARIQGPSAPPVGGVVVAGQPGTYRFNAYAAVGQSWGQHVVAYADLPLTPAPPPVVGAARG